MNFEQNRLETFQDWPSDAVVSAARIAKAGFFSLRDGVKVECFSCHVQIVEWSYGDQVMAKHRTLNPECQFVLNPVAAGNVPIISSNPTSTPSSSTPSTLNDMKNEEGRLQTFENWPVSHIVRPEALARAGFFYLNKSDRTKCAYCNGVVSKWEPHDDPDKEHKRHFPNCPFVQSTIIPRIKHGILRDVSMSNLELVDSPNLEVFGLTPHKGPKRPDVATVEARLATFAAWPPDLMQTPDILAQAGFYYEGNGDQVRCFHCDGGLRHWDPPDDPWTEHARWFPTCAFLKIVKGQEFISACAIENHEGSNLEEVSSVVQQPAPPKRRTVTERELQEHMISEVTRAVLDIGINVERVKRAIREKLGRTGRGFSQPDALVEAALNLQHEEEDLSPENESCQLSQSIRNTLRNLIKESTDSTSVESHVAKSVVVANVTSDNQPATVSDDVKKELTLEEENRLLKEARLCKICMDSEVGVVFLPCGHFATCVNCAPNLQDCPVCRSAIKATVRTFLA